jgi:rhodanese-related sulfurtransferase
MITRSREHQTIEQVLAAARARLSRVSPRQAHEEAAGGALLVDIRPHAQRSAEGEIPGAMVVERNVLEWRFDPTSGAHLPEASYDLRIIVVCSEGYTSSLAAAALQDLGISRATDMAGGFRAWELDGLPTVSPERRTVS